MAEEINTPENGDQSSRASGYHMGDVETVISVEDVNRQAMAMAEVIGLDKISDLANNNPYVSISNLKAGYGKMEILHGLNLQVAKGQSLCLIGSHATVLPAPAVVCVL